MVYGYIRVSTDKQTVDNQRYEINNYCKEKGVKIDKWVSEVVAGTTVAKKRKLGPLLNKMKKGDTLIVTEISRLGRNLMQIMGILNLCMSKDTHVFTVKERYELGDNINSQILAFAFGLSAQIERDLISQRTKEGLARRKAEGRRLGRSPGSKNKRYKLSGKEREIQSFLKQGKSIYYIAKHFKCHHSTVKNMISVINN